MLSQFEKDALEAMSDQLDESTRIIKAVLKWHSDTFDEQHAQETHLFEALKDIRRVSASAVRLVGGDKNV